MTDSEKFTMLKNMTGEADEAVLFTYYQLAAGIVIAHAYPFSSDDALTVPTKYDSVQVEIAAYLFNKRGAEGETAHSENGVSRTYDDGEIPPTLLRRIVPIAGVV